MRYYDILLVGLLALIPIVYQDGWNENYAFLPIFRILLSIVMCFYILKFFSFYFDNYHSKTILQISIVPDYFDFVVGLIWGSVIFQYFEFDYLSLFFWVMMGFAIIGIGFLGNTVIHTTKGIRLQKHNKWIAWEAIKTIILNENFALVQTLDNKFVAPILASSISKSAFNDYNNSLIQITNQYKIPILKHPSDSLLITYIDSDNTAEAEILDDLFTKNTAVILLMEEGLMLADVPFFIQKQKITRITFLKKGIGIWFRHSWFQMQSKILYQTDFEENDWNTIELFFRKWKENDTQKR